MFEKVFGILCLVNLNLAYGTDSCKTYVCLNWRVSLDELKLTCKVSKLHFKVLILNQFGKVQAACIPPTPLSKCDPYYGNATISQNPETNETTFIVRGHIDYHINGIWTCRHGRDRDEARIEVTILKTQEKYNTTKLRKNRNSSCSHQSNLQVPDTSCITSVLFTATVSYLVSVILSLLLLTCVKTGWKEIDDVFKNVSGCINCDMNISTKILVCKRIAFVICSGVFEISAVLFGLVEERNCVFQWIFIACGLIFGVMISFMFLSNVATDIIDHQTDHKNADKDITQATHRIDDQTDPKNADKDVTQDSIDGQTDPNNAKKDVTEVSTVVIAADVHNNANTDANPATDSIDEQTDPNDAKKDVTKDEEVENETDRLISSTA